MEDLLINIFAEKGIELIGEQLLKTINPNNALNDLLNEANSIHRKLDQLIDAPFREAMLYLREGKIEIFKERIRTAISVNENNIPARLAYVYILCDDNNYKLATEELIKVYCDFTQRKDLFHEEILAQFHSIEMDFFKTRDNLNIKCKYQKIDDNNYLVTSTEYIEGEIVTQLRINYKNEICADSSIDITFNDLLSNDDFEKKECSEETGLDKTYHIIGDERVDKFVNENNLKVILKKIDMIHLSYRGYLGVDDFEKFSEHPVDHVTYAKTIAFSKNVILFIFCFYYIFCSFFIFYHNENKNYKCLINSLFIIYFISIAFNFAYCIHVIFTYLRVKGIVSTVNLDGIQIYRTGLRWFIFIDIFILFGIVFDFVLKLLQFLIYRKKSEENKQLI